LKSALRDYQRKALAAFLAAGHATLKMAPGSGKTLVACAAIEALGSPPTVVITPTLDLVKQWERVLSEQGISCAAVITYSLAARHADDEDFWAGTEFAVADEMHHLQEGESFRRVLVPIFQMKHALGLSATPSDDPENIALQVLPVVFEYTLADSLRDGFAAPLEVVRVPVDLSDEERAEYKRLTDKIRFLISKYGEDRYHTKVYEKDPMTGRNVYGGQITTERKQLVSLADAKFVEVLSIVRGLDAPRILVWSEYLEALERARAVLVANGVSVDVIHGGRSKEERAQVLADWGTRFRVLLAAKVGEEGIDAPEAAHGIILAGARTTRQNVQRVGRLLRPGKNNKTARVWLVYARGTMEEKLIGLVESVAGA